jgi:hypothetical protein
MYIDVRFVEGEKCLRKIITYVVKKVFMPPTVPKTSKTLAVSKIRQWL